MHLALWKMRGSRLESKYLVFSLTSWIHAFCSLHYTCAFLWEIKALHVETQIYGVRTMKCVSSQQDLMHVLLRKVEKKNLIFISFFPMRWKCKNSAGVRQRPALPRMRIQVGDQVSLQFSWQTHQPTSWYQSGRSVDTSQWIVASFNFKYWQLFKMHSSSCACVILFLVCVINWFTLNWPVTQLNEAALSKVKHVAIIQTDSMWWNDRCV